MPHLEFRPFNYANTDQFGGARLYRGDQWIGTVWRYVCGWSWCLVCHPAKIGGGAEDYDDGRAILLSQLSAFENVAEAM